MASSGPYLTALPGKRSGGSHNGGGYGNNSMGGHGNNCGGCQPQSIKIKVFAGGSSGGFRK